MRLEEKNGKKRNTPAEEAEEQRQLAEGIRQFFHEEKARRAWEGESDWEQEGVPEPPVPPGLECPKCGEARNDFLQFEMLPQKIGQEIGEEISVVIPRMTYRTCGYVYFVEI